MSLTYTEGEKILAYHGPFLYEAKILKLETRPDAATARNKPYYFIHYNGWKDRYNEWVDDTRIMKWTDENLQKQASLKDEFGDKGKPKGNKVRPPHGISLTGQPKDKEKEKKQSKPGSTKRRKREDGDDDVDSSGAPTRFDLQVPKYACPQVLLFYRTHRDLQRKLYEDWEKISKQKMLLPLPRSPSVSEILSLFFSSMPAPREYDKELHDGLKYYFEASLGTLLLYRFERVQYEAFAKGNLSQTYGAEHLLRLIVKLPELLVHVELEDEPREQLRQTLVQLLAFMSEKPSLVFSGVPYAPAPPNCITNVSFPSLCLTL